MDQHGDTVHQTTRWRRRSEVIGVATVVIGLIALVPAFGSYINDLLHNPPSPSASPTPGPAPATTGGTASPSGAAPSGNAGGNWVSLWTVPRLGGTLTAPPDAVRDDSRYRDARFVECPDNQTSQTHELTFELGAGYQEARLEVRAWGDTTRPDRMNLVSFTRTRQRDGTLDKLQKQFVSLTANGEPGTLTVRTPGVQELVLQLSCAQPQQMLAVTGAWVRP